MLKRRTVGPTSYPVSLSEAKELLRVDYTDEDAFILNLISGCTGAIGGMAGRVMSPETWEVAIGYSEADTVDLPLSPVRELTSITYFDRDDQEVTLDVADFYLTRDDDYACVMPKLGQNWPAANTARPDAITLTLEVGYTNCPGTLKSAVLLLIGHLFKNREAAMPTSMAELPLGVDMLVAQERVGWAAA